jgi:hypothetical protein
VTHAAVGPPTTSPTSARSGPLDDVVDRMTELLSPLSRSDGVACFIRLYLAVTRSVRRLAATEFDNPGFLAELDREFASLFFAAAAASDATRPPAWKPLFDSRGRKHVAPIQFALAGMNAHINRDLPIALVTCFSRANKRPADNSPEHADYLHVNGVLATVEEEVKRDYMTGWLNRLDSLIHPINRLDDRVAMWDISRARDAAWTNAQVLWELGATPSLYNRFLETLDHTVELAGRGLLTPADTWLRIVTRPRL